MKVQIAVLLVAVIAGVAVLGLYASGLRASVTVPPCQVESVQTGFDTVSYDAQTKEYVYNVQYPQVTHSMTLTRYVTSTDEYGAQVYSGLLPNGPVVAQPGYSGVIVTLRLSENSLQTSVTLYTC